MKSSKLRSGAGKPAKRSRLFICCACFCCSLVVVLLILAYNAQDYSYGNNNSHPIKQSKPSKGRLDYTVDQQIAQPLAKSSKKHVKDANEQPAKIAYIFAGSVRSFLCPRVHWSIRMHLMDALGGESYSFIRLSLEDNENTRTGKGNIREVDYNMAELNATLAIFNPRTVEYFKLSTQLEEMQANFPSLRHSIFRENDLRRYSMFYHRCMAYLLALKYEHDHGIKFDWVVLVRLDAAWLEPVLPIRYYDPNTVWITETGYVPLNDQFMLIPRKYSDYLYDLDTKLQPNVYCLGGPDVEQWKCNATILQSLTPPLSPERINATLEACCPDVFELNRIGFSETIHFSHLLYGNIPISMGHFPVYLTRYFKNRKNEQCYGDCPRLTYNFKVFAFDVLQKEYAENWSPMSPVDTRSLPISETDSSRCAYFNRPDSSDYRPISAYNLLQIAQNASSAHSALDYQVSLYKQWEHLHPSLQFNPVAYSAWRIHPGWNTDGCLTVNFTDHQLSWSDCRQLLDYKSGRRHDPRQFFILHLKPHHSIITRDPVRLTGDIEPLDFANLPLPKWTKIAIQRRHPVTYDLERIALCWTISSTKGGDGKRVIELQPCDVPEGKVNPFDKAQWFKTVEGQTQGAHPITTVAMIQSKKFPTQCIARGPHEDAGLSKKIVHNRLSVFACDGSDINTVSRLYFEFEYLHS